MGRPGELGELGASAAAGPAPPGPNTRPNTRPNAQPDAQPSAQPGLAKHPVAEPPAAAPLATRVQASTPFGGLLFLLNLAGELGWPQRWLADPVLGARGPRWGLHQLALRLLPLQAKDPAALALAGLLPNAEPPDANAPAPSAAEAQALQVVRGELLLALRRRLPGVVTALGMPLDAGQDVPVDAALDTGLDAAADAALLAWVCRRQARILADPGWLELHLSLDDVRTEIRGAGLDLNPGWLPWLGLVIRIVYD